MAIIFYGSKQTPIGMGEFLIKCPCCESHHWADVMVVSHYYHIYWIPMFPFDKDAHIICKKCGLKRYGRNFDATLIDNYQEVKDNYRHPWFTYIGAATLTAIFLLILVAASI